MYHETTRLFFGGISTGRDFCNIVLKTNIALVPACTVRCRRPDVSARRGQLEVTAAPPDDSSTDVLRPRR